MLGQSFNYLLKEMAKIRFIWLFIGMFKANVHIIQPCYYLWWEICLGLVLGIFLILVSRILVYYLTFSIWCNVDMQIYFQGMCMSYILTIQMLPIFSVLSTFYLFFLPSLNVCSLFNHLFVTLYFFPSLLLFLVFYLGYIYILEIRYSHNVCLS